VGVTISVGVKEEKRVGVFVIETCVPVGGMGVSDGVVGVTSTMMV
jgi:hypothetical protein